MGLAPKKSDTVVTFFLTGEGLKTFLDLVDDDFVETLMGDLEAGT